MKKFFAIVLALILALGVLSACGSKSDSITIAVPNDATNEARALLLLQEKGYIKLKDGAGITATINDIEENPHNIKFNELDAAQIPNVLKDVDYAVINSNFAISAGLNPVKDSLAIEGSSSAYSNILAVKEGTENSDSIKALKAALESKQVADYISEKYDGAVVSTVDNPTDGFDSTVDYDALAGTSISVAASPTPHAEILSVVKDILAEKTSPSKFWNSLTMSSRTTSWKAAKSTPITSSICPIWRTSTPRTARTSFPSPPSMWNPWVSTAASRPRSTRSVK